MNLFRDHVVIDLPYREILAAARLDTVQRVLDVVGDDVVAWSRSSDTVRVQLTRNGSWTGAVFIKRYHYATWKCRFKAMLRGTFFGKHRPRVEYEALDLMRKLGVQAVRPIAYGQRRLFHFVTDCFLITEAVPEAVSLSTFAISFRSDPGDRLSPKQRHRMIGELARRVRQMHDAGFAHGGLFWRNVLFRRVPDGYCEFHFLDASPGRRVWRKEPFDSNKVEDVAALRTLAGTFCHKTDMIRFAKAYFGIRRFDSRQRTWLSQVDRLAEKYREHEMYRLKMNQLFQQHEHNLRRVRFSRPSGRLDGRQSWTPY